MAIIEVKDLSKTFETKEGKVEALKDINLTVEAGDIYGIIGMSGAGKSTLVRCLNFLERPTKGHVLIEGKDLGAMKEVELRHLRRSISMIFQGFNLLMQKSVLDNVCFPLIVQGIGKQEARKKAEELLETVGIRDKMGAYPSQLSGGQKQRVAIARALASDPKILLCDEATSALDPQTTSSILSLLSDINRKTGITIVIITHQMSVVRDICHHVAIVEDGEIVERGAVEDIFTHPKSRAAKRLIIDWKDPDEWEDDPEALLRNPLQIAPVPGATRIRVVFRGNAAYEPIVSTLTKDFHMDCNILRADIKEMRGETTGEMVMDLIGDKVVQEDAIAYLKEKGFGVQVIETP
ncbi:MAG: ATP-binding cassette domain-containing protein [Lachnospiraceae bacterium]|nr:ATP-binding cassette domain-containing protein [Lachnospiraceae bacterium]